MNANREWLSSAPVTAACQKLKVEREAEADKAKWALEMLQNDADRLGHFYLEIGTTQQDNPVGLIRGGCIERKKGGPFIVSRWIQEPQWRDPKRVDAPFDNLADAFVRLTEEE